jgi:hypothetical protein
MSVRATLTASADVLLAERATALARLIETHPGYHLLAEYEALFVDRHACAAETVPCRRAAADDLLARMNDVIMSLTSLMEPASRPEEDRQLVAAE